MTIRSFLSDRHQRLMKAFAMVAMCLALPACVSSTTSSVKTETPPPQSQLALTEEQRKNQDARKKAVAEIHAKAAAMPYNEDAPANGYMKPGATSLLTPEEIEAKTRRIKAIAGQLPADATSQEMETKQKRINHLKRRGTSHYDSAMNSITSETPPPASN